MVNGGRASATRFAMAALKVSRTHREGSVPGIDEAILQKGRSRIALKKATTGIYSRKINIDRVTD